MSWPNRAKCIWRRHLAVIRQRREAKGRRRRWIRERLRFHRVDTLGGDHRCARSRLRGPVDRQVVLIFLEPLVLRSKISERACGFGLSRCFGQIDGCAFYRRSGLGQGSHGRHHQTSENQADPKPFFRALHKCANVRNGSQSIEKMRASNVRFRVLQLLIISPNQYGKVKPAKL